MTNRVLNKDVKKELNYIQYGDYVDGCKITLQSKISEKVICEFVQVGFDEINNSISESSFTEIERFDDMMVITVTNDNLVNVFTITDIKILWDKFVDDYEVSVPNDMTDDDRDDLLDEYRYNLYNTVLWIEKDLEIPLLTYKGIVEKIKSEY